MELLEQELDRLHQRQRLGQQEVNTRLRIEVHSRRPIRKDQLEHYQLEECIPSSLAALRPAVAPTLLADMAGTLQLVPRLKCCHLELFEHQ